MRILHVSPSYFPAVGGAEVYLQRLSEGLASRGHNVTVLTANVNKNLDLWPPRHGNLPEKEVVNGVNVLRFPPDGGWFGSGIERWLELPGGYRSLRLLFRPEGFDLLRQGPRATFSIIPRILRSGADVVASMNWFWPPAFYAYLARRIKTFRLIGIPLFHTAQPWCHRHIYKRMLRQCDAVIALTEFEANFARERGAARAEVAGGGIDLQAFESRDGGAVRARYGLGDRPVIGLVGRQDPNKGVCLLLDAIKRIWDWNPEVRLVLAGPRPPASSQVEALLREFAPVQRERIVCIHDFAEREKASIFDALDVLVLPSTAESFGLAYPEAWACGKPVIGARIGPTQCVIDQGVDGLLVDPNDPADLAEAIIRLLSDPAERERMGQKGNGKVRARFTWDRVIDQVERVYCEVRASGA